MRPPLGLWAALVLVVCLGGCSLQRTVLPLRGPAAAGAQPCGERCQSRFAAQVDALHECLLNCPGARREAGGCTSAEVPPEAQCVERRRYSTTAIVLWMLGGLVVGAAAGGVVWAVR